MNFLTALRPSYIACIANSYGNNNLTHVSISLSVNVLLLLYLINYPDNIVIYSNTSYTIEFIIFIAFLFIPFYSLPIDISFNTLYIYNENVSFFFLLIWLVLNEFVL